MYIVVDQLSQPELHLEDILTENVQEISCYTVRCVFHKQVLLSSHLIVNSLHLDAARIHYSLLYLFGLWWDVH